MKSFPLIPKTVGTDAELGNFILRPKPITSKTAAEAVDRLLAELPGIPSDARSKGGSMLDRKRRYFPATGGSAYDDSDHLELALPEAAGARENLALWHSALGQVRVAQAAANEKLGPHGQLRVHISNSDGFGQSFGGHMNYTVSRSAFLRTVRDPLAIGHLASFQSALAVLTGQGKAGSEHGLPPVDFQLSQRADFMCVLVSSDTMVNRSLVNSRDEAHAAHEIARQHVICFDSTLSHIGRFVNVGAMQLELCLLELGCIDPALVLSQPIDAMQAWSRDPALARDQALALGGRTTLVSLLRRYHDAMSRLVASGVCKGIVPDAEEALAQFATLLDLAAARDYTALARRVDWAAKLALLKGAAEEHDIAWHSPEMKRLDHQWGALDDGFYWDALADGSTESLLSEDDLIPRAPKTTRAFTRAKLLQLAPPDCVEQIDWEHLIFDLPAERPSRSRYVQVSLPLPFAHGEADSGIADATTLDEALRILAEQGAVTEVAPYRPFFKIVPTIPATIAFSSNPQPHLRP